MRRKAPDWHVTSTRSHPDRDSGIVDGVSFTIVRNEPPLLLTTGRGLVEVSYEGNPPKVQCRYVTRAPDVPPGDWMRYPTAVQGGRVRTAFGTDVWIPKEVDVEERKTLEAHGYSSYTVVVARAGKKPLGRFYLFAQTRPTSHGMIAAAQVLLDDPLPGDELTLIGPEPPLG